MRCNFSTVTGFLLLLLLCSCGPDSHNQGRLKKGGTATIALQGSIVSLFPLNIRDYDAWEISENLLNMTLTSTDTDGETVPLIAERWEINSDKTKIIYFLRPEKKWSNGQDVTSADVKATFEFINSHKDYVSFDYTLDLIKTISLRDSLTIVFEFRESIPDPLRLTRFPILNSKQIAENSSWDKLNEAYHNSFVGCGPFLLKKYSDQQIVVTRNDLFEPAAQLDRLEIMFYRENDSLEKWVDQQTIDLAPDVPHTMVMRIKNNRDFQTLTSIERGFTFLGWNLKHAEISLFNVRKGLSLALDRNAMVDGIMSGYAEVQDAPSYPEFWAHFKTDQQPYDIEKARDFLRQSGWKFDPSLRKLMKNSTQLSINLLTNKENILRNKIAQNIKSYWQALGAEVIIKSLAWNDFFIVLHEGDYDVALVSWVANNDFNPSELFHSESIASDNNFMNYQSDSVDLFIQNALNKSDPENRKENWIKLQKKIIDDMPVTVLFNKKLVNIVLNSLKGIKINSNGYLINAKEWWRDDRE